MPRWILLLLALRLLPAQGWDGCGAGRWKCGDKCIYLDHPSRQSKCKCGESSVVYESGQWCCGSGCIPGKKDLLGGVIGASCPAGTVLGLNQSCHGACNYHPEDWFRGPRSHIAACTDTTLCVKEGELCQGASVCKDKGDLEWCSRQERRQEECPWRMKGQGSPWRSQSSVAYTGCNSTGGFPGQCIPTSEAGEGTSYKCFDRSDEDPYQGSKQRLNLTKLLKDCKTKDGSPGLTCSGRKGGCLKMNRWCLSGKAVSCQELGGRLSYDKELCGQFDFWQNKPCREGESRCRGRNSGQCRSLGKCEDGSHEIQAAKDGRCPEGWFQCGGDPSLCLGPGLVCDQHSQCPGGEDERDCIEEYRKKGYILEKATYRCQSIHHNQNTANTRVRKLTWKQEQRNWTVEDLPTAVVWTLGVRCDGVEECWGADGAEDEQGCGASQEHYACAGRGYNTV